MGNVLKHGQIYVSKGGCATYAVLIHEVAEDGTFSCRDTSSRNTYESFSPGCDPHETQEQFLSKHKLATPKELEEILATLKEQAEVVSDKIRLLEIYCNQPKTKETNR